MRGLAFPEAATFEREESYDTGTPFSSRNADDIPIDPALNDPPLDPALLEQTNGVQPSHVEPPPHLALSPPILYNRQYSQGPHGDPFAPQPIPSYLPVEEPAMPAPRPPKKKRKVVRSKECDFCRAKGLKDVVHERLLSCTECGRSGHPSCLQISSLGEVPFLYDWRCIECKSCEMCRQKGDENRLLFCDACDRGWHMDCLQPPLEETPSGEWYCPNCTPREQYLAMQSYADVPEHPLPPHDFIPPPTPRPRESSVASSSRSAPHTTHNKQKRKGKARAVTTDESEVDAEGEVDVDVEATPVPVRSHKRKGSKARGRSRKGAAEVIQEPETSRPFKSVRLRITSPVPPPPPPRQPSPSPQPSRPMIRLKLTARTAKGKEREEEPEELKKGMFDDLLSAEDRDISQTNVSQLDKMRFDRSRLEAERAVYPPKPPSASLEPPETPIAGPSNRPLRSAYIQPPPLPTPGLSESPAPSTPDFSKIHSAPHQRIRSIRFGEFDIQTWYDAPFPEEYANLPDGRLWICEFCLKYMKSQFVASRHQMKCRMRHPPGDEIYRDGFISIFEVDGRKNKIYCQNLCLLSKMFLDHKSLFYDVEPFLFYVMTEVDESIGSRFVGYFSKEKRSPKDYNVSCIMTLPVRQRQGWGNLLIDFSYLLSKKEQRTGSPEKPLSALGALGYRNYWTLALMRYLRDAPSNPRLEDISRATSMTIEDIYVTLQQQQMIFVRDHTPPSRPPPGKAIKLFKGKKNGIARKHLVRTTTQDVEQGLTKAPFVAPQSYDIAWDPEVVEAYMSKWEAKGYFKLKPDCLKWSPFLIARTMKSDGLPEEGDPSIVQEPLETPSMESPPDLSDLNGGVTPKAGLSSRARSRRTPRNRLDSASAAPSPALNLFDEPVGEVESSAPPPDPDELPSLPPARPNLRLSMREEEEEPVRASSRRGKQWKARQEEEEEEEEVVLRRSGRKSTVVSMSTSPSQKSNETPSKSKGRSRKTRTNSTNGHSQLNGVSPSEADPSEPHDESMIADDEAFAMRLAMEEGGPRRQLRSRSNTSQEVRTIPQIRPTPKRAIPPPPTPPSQQPPRKRRRVDPSPDPPSSPPPLPPVRRRTSTTNSRKLSQVSTSTPPTPVSPNATFNARQRRSSRLTNGGPAIDVTPPPELRRTRSGALRRRVQSPVDEDEDEGDTAPVVSQSDSAVVPQPLDAGGLSTAAAASADDVKCEDMDTPLTGGSRQSAPSDDTVFVAEDQRTKVTPVSPIAVEVPGVVADDADADAEGEDDIDAEGEPDDGDLDAEGEPDLGDEDAEGEVDDELGGESEVVMML
ncbi:hypothetical protein BXZ70DRAFT_1021503 [Cristinia sonorae]|uniref:Histone acetyltransferase n=1 Tax=Cristinia sonorae TaxID=1940300 RepID=A0A8K0UQ28_9AGAR|nr:hypothetical protein BXZ70DRAFT_1021503 [Cristinia sonorae]